MAIISIELLNKENEVQDAMLRLQKAMINNENVEELQKEYNKAKEGYDELLLKHFEGRI